MCGDVKFCTNRYAEECLLARRQEDEEGTKDEEGNVDASELGCCWRYDSPPPINCSLFSLSVLSTLPTPPATLPPHLHSYCVVCMQLLCSYLISLSMLLFVITHTLHPTVRCSAMQLGLRSMALALATTTTTTTTTAPPHHHQRCYNNPNS